MHWRGRTAAVAAPPLTRLNLRQNRVGDAGALALAQHASWSLNVGQNRVGAAGCAALLSEMRPGARVIAVQPEAAPVIVRSFREGQPLEVPGESVADGLVSHETVPFAFEVFCRHVAEGWLCGERDILAAVHALAESAHLLAEPSGAAGLAAAWAHRESLRGRRVVLAITGGNCSVPQLRKALATPPLFAIADVAGG